MNPGEHKHFDPLYAKDNKGKIKVWKVRVTALVSGPASIVVEWGN